MVLGVLEASNWGWIHPKNSPVEPFGFALTPFVVAGGALLLWAFAVWERYREQGGHDALLHLRLLGSRVMRCGLATMLAQNLILMGVFFTVPLFLQIVQGLDALETGVRMLPASAGLFVSAIAGSALAKRFAAKPLVRIGLLIVLVATLLLLDTIQPNLDNASFLIAMGVLGIGMGLVVSQLGNVVQSAVGDSDRSEAGGLQFTAQQLGSSLGTAFLGAIVITGLIAAFTAKVESSPAISQSVKGEVQQEARRGLELRRRRAGPRRRRGRRYRSGHHRRARAATTKTRSSKRSSSPSSSRRCSCSPRSRPPATCPRAASTSSKPSGRRRAASPQRLSPSASSSRRLRGVCQRRPSQRLQT